MQVYRRKERGYREMVMGLRCSLWVRRRTHVAQGELEGEERGKHNATFIQNKCGI